MPALVSKTYAPLDQIEITELPTPAAGPGQLLVRVQAAALNPLDVKMVTGVFREMFPVEHPFVLGYEAAGTVEAVGEGVTGFVKGDEVVALTFASIAEYTLVNAGPAVVHRPSGVDAVHAAALPVAGLMAAQLLDRAGLESGDRLLVVGATGGIGVYLMQLAAQRDVEVWATARPDETDFVLALGAEHVVDYTNGDIAAQVDGVDVVIDLVNVGADIPSAALRNGGRIVSPLGAWGNYTYDRGITATYARIVPNADTLRDLLEAVESGNLTVQISGTSAFDDSVKATNDFFGSHRRGKHVITF
ncbi:MAG: NADPH:quinone reductase [Acidimicrobiaceae bacterium]|jgi:NADPH:quinone reductase-like Zn-dependent oxidoreductase|nr:NADPH:quinone reductase [Acidimicrobiaceae bacterium]